MIGVAHTAQIHRDRMKRIAKRRRDEIPPMRVRIVPVDKEQIPLTRFIPG